MLLLQHSKSRRRAWPLSMSKQDLTCSSSSTACRISSQLQLLRLASLPLKSSAILVCGHLSLRCAFLWAYMLQAQQAGSERD